MSPSYAVVWSENGTFASGRLDSLDDRFELQGRGCGLTIAFADLERAGIERGRSDRLHGLPVLELGRSTGPPVRIASLQGTAALHELFDYVERAIVSPVSVSGNGK
jgi:hypothetical protein